MTVAIVTPIETVADHPQKTTCSVLTVLGGQTVVSEKLDDGQGAHRYAVGDYVVFVADKAVCPDWLLKRGFWDETTNRSYIKNNRVKASNFGGVRSHGILFPVIRDEYGLYVQLEHSNMLVHPDHDVTSALGITA